MSKNYAYIRISDNNKQDAKGQRDRISKYADENGLLVSKWFEYELSGSKTSKTERGLIELIEKLKKGDRVLVNDIERLGRDSISDILEVITRIINNECEIHFCLSGDVLAPKHKNDLATFFITMGRAFAATEYSKERSLKAKAAAERRKLQNLPTGRPAGTIVKSKLDKHESVILFWLSQDVPKYEIANRQGVAASTLDKWLSRRDELICQARECGIYEKGMGLSEIKKALKRRLAG